MLRRWENLPEFMRTDEIRPYWEILWKLRFSIFLKRVLDIIIAQILLIILVVPMFVISVAIKLDSPGPVIYRQRRVTKYGKIFRIHKFRTMIQDADRFGSSVTSSEDFRITKIGKKIRKLRLDELPQIFDVLEGNMSFVGARPEVIKYVKHYKHEYYATFLMPAGITSEASIKYKDEDRLLTSMQNIDQVYIEKILPEKMKWNLEGIKRFGVLRDAVILFRTVFAVLGKD